MTTGRINQVTAFPEKLDRSIARSASNSVPAAEAEECLEGFLSERDTELQHIRCVSSQRSNCLDALLNVLPALNQRFERQDKRAGSIGELGSRTTKHSLDCQAFRRQS